MNTKTAPPGKIVKALLAHLGTQTAVAEALCVRKTTVFRWQHGFREMDTAHRRKAGRVLKEKSGCKK